MLYYINNGHEILKVDEKTNKVVNLHTKESTQVAYRAMYMIEEDGVILYEDKVTSEGQKLKVKAGDIVMLVEENVPVIIKDKAFGLQVGLFFDSLKQNNK